jgi:hypothetical protein
MATEPATVPTPAAAVTPAVTPAQTVPTPATPPAVPAAESKPATLLGDLKPADVKAEPQKPAEIKYELKAPEKSLLPATHAEKIVALAKERGFSNEQAQAVYEAESAHFKEYVDTAVQAEQKKVAGWKDDLMKDPSFSGDKLAEYNTGATELINKYGDPELMKLLQDTGFAYHKSVARFLQKVHNASKPDKVVAPGAPAAKPGERDNSFDAVAARMFPNTAGKK